MRTPPLSRQPGGRASSWDNTKGHERRGQSWLDKSFWVELASRRPWRGRRRSRDIGDGSAGGRQGRRAWVAVGGIKRGNVNVQLGEASPLLGTGQFEV